MTDNLPVDPNEYIRLEMLALMRSLGIDPDDIGAVRDFAAILRRMTLAEAFGQSLNALASITDEIIVDLKAQGFTDEQIADMQSHFDVSCDDDDLSPYGDISWKID